MKKKLILVTCLIFVLSVLTTAQTPIPVKIGFVRVADLYSGNGIKRLFAAVEAINREFKPQEIQIERDWKGVTALDNESKAAKLAGNADLAWTKGTAAVALAGQLRAKLDAIKAARAGKERDIVYPIYQTVLKALEAYGKAKGYEMVLDATFLDSVVYTSPFVKPEAADITAAFVADFNASPAGAVPPQP